MTEVQLFTDGACVPNPGKGGWAAILRSSGYSKEIAGCEPSTTTNNRMEMLAVIRGLECLKRPCKVHVVSDSMIVVGLLNRTGMKPAKRKNQDLVQQILNLMEPHQVTAEWIKGHAGHTENERCDALAMQALEGNMVD